MINYNKCRILKQKKFSCGNEVMMNLAVEAYILMEEFGEERAFAEIKKAGFDAVDYSFYWWSEEKTMLTEDYLKKAEKTCENLRKAGLVCNQAHAPFAFQYGEEMDLSCRNYLDIVRSMEYASVIGAKHIVVHGIKVPEGADTEECFAYNCRYYKSLEEYCKKFNIRIAVENLTNSAFRTPDKMNRMMEMLDSEWFVTCLDVGHAQLVNYQPEDYINHLTPGILKALHIHDNFGLNDNHLIPYTGILKWDRITEALALTGYSEDFTLEVVGFLGKYHGEALLQALKLCGMVGHELTGMIERN